jgi:DNA polymerase-3 subunit alpha
MTKTNKPMGFVTLEDIQGNIELVLFPRTWEKTREMLTVGQIVIVEGKVDTNSTPPKVLVDTVRTEIKILEPLKDVAPHSKLLPDSAVEALSQPKPDSHVQDLKIQSTQPKSSAVPPKPDPVKKVIQQPRQNGPLTKNVPTKPTVPPPIRQVAERPSAYIPDSDLDGMPPPPDNFPDGWDTQWQPSFEEAVIASKPEPKFKKSEEITPPRIQLETVPVQMPDEIPEQDDTTREALVTSIYIPLATEEDKTHPPQQITVILRSTGDRERDKRRIKTIYGTLISFHGRDRFSFQVFENGSGYLIDFPNDTTRICPEMLERLKKLMGEESWRVEEITFQ